MTATIEGVKVSGTPEEIAALIKALGIQTKSQDNFRDYKNGLLKPLYIHQDMPKQVNSYFSQNTRERINAHFGQSPSYSRNNIWSETRC